jgi:signal transduction histidine kinase
VTALEGAVVALVAVDVAEAEGHAEAMRAAGAIVRTCTLQVDDFSTLSEPGVDAAIFMVGSDPERFAPAVQGLRVEAPLAELPVVCIVDPALPVGRLGPLGAVTLVSGTPEETDAGLAKAVADAALFRRTAAENVRRERMLDAQIRVTLERLTVLGRETQTFAHDARVLHGIVVGFAANLRDGIAGPVEPSQINHAQHILDATQEVTTLLDRHVAAALRCTELTDELTRPPSVRAPARRTLEDLEVLVRGIARLFENVAAKKSTAVDVVAFDSVVLFCDAMQIKQVITNLLTNAIKFSPPAGKVSLELRLVEPSSGTGVAARKRAELRVSDTGPGIPDAHRERVFERGVRLERDRALAGSGIGLAVVKEIAERHGGDVHVETAETGGAAFVVTLPLDMRSRHADAPPSSSDLRRLV